MTPSQRYRAKHPERAKSNTNRASKKWRSKNPQVNRERQRMYNWKSMLRVNYGLTIEQYHALLEKQGGGCAICGAGPSQGKKRRLDVDHCHSSKKVRGLLCASCNCAIGLFKEDINLLHRAIAYLIAHQ
jgi:hypothetical protein